MYSYESIVIVSTAPKPTADSLQTYLETYAARKMWPQDYLEKDPKYVVNTPKYTSPNVLDSDKYNPPPPGFFPKQITKTTNFVKVA